MITCGRAVRPGGAGRPPIHGGRVVAVVRAGTGSGGVLADVTPAGDRRRARTGAEFGIDPVHMVLNGLLGEHQLRRDLAVGVPLRDKRHDLSLTDGKAERASHRVHAAGPHLTSGPRLPAKYAATHGTNTTLMSARGVISL